MFTIERTHYGLKVVSGGNFATDDVNRLRAEVFAHINTIAGPFSILIDSRGMFPVGPSVRDAFHDLHAAIWAAGCTRIAFVIQSPVTRQQVRQMHHAAAPACGDRIFDSSVDPDWERHALAWAADGVEPADDLLSDTGPIRAGRSRATSPAK